MVNLSFTQDVYLYFVFCIIMKISCNFILHEGKINMLTVVLVKHDNIKEYNHNAIHKHTFTCVNP